MGRVQSINSFSTVDGPGTRCVVFLQGCPVHCVFCHNPDSWDPNEGEEVETGGLLRRLERYRTFLRVPGLTVSGGEPLYQPDFALDLMRGAKELGWHVALDTSGWGPEKQFAKVVKEADLVMFSIKHPVTPEKLSDCDFQQVLTNWRVLGTIPVKVWLRYVLIPGWTDQPETIEALKTLALELPNLEKVEVLPFNSLAGDKWVKLGRLNRFLESIKTRVTEKQIRQAEELIGKH